MSFDPHHLLASMLVSRALSTPTPPKKENKDAFSNTKEWKKFYYSEDPFSENLNKLAETKAEGTVLQFLNTADDVLAKYSRQDWVPVIALMFGHNFTQILNYLYNKYSKYLRMLPYVDEMVASLVANSPSLEAIGLDALKLMHDKYGAMFSNPMYFFYVHHRNLPMLKYVYDLGHFENPQGMFLNKKDATTMIETGWLEGAKYVIEEQKQMPRTRNAVALFKQLNRNDDSYEQALECIRYLVEKEILTADREDIEAILPPAVRDNIFIVSCLPKNFFTSAVESDEKPQTLISSTSTDVV
jgi:hypothetical protein